MTSANGCTHEVQVTTPEGPVRIRVRSAAEGRELAERVRAAVRGGHDDFADVPLPEGTAFQRACWAACRTIPRGQTRTYAWLAAAAGRPGAARAAGQAMRRNPMPVVVPCHRVVGSGAWIGGYSGSAAAEGPSIQLKRWLLNSEQGHADVAFSAHHSAGTPLPPETGHTS